MATAKLKLDTRNITSDNTFPLVIHIGHQSQTRFIPMGVMLTVGQWNPTKDGYGSITNHINSKRETTRVQKKLGDVRYYLTNNAAIIKKIDINSLKTRILKEIFRKEESNEEFPEDIEKVNLQNKKKKSELLGVYGDILIKKLKSTNDPSDINNANWFLDGINSFKKFNNDHDIQMIDITSNFLEDYKNHWMKKISKHEAKINTLSARLRAIRALMNRARKEKPPVLDFNHKPFEEIEIPSQEANKRAIGIEPINKIREVILEQNSFEWHQRNYFLFMFNNQGMNFVDIAHLKVYQISNGRLNYIRSKTKRAKKPKEFNIKQTDEAIKILSYYLPGKKPSDFVFPILTNELEKNAVALVNIRKKALKNHNTTMTEIAKACGIDEKVTSYVVRHSWADIAKKSGATTETIKDALGQSNVIITETYLKSFDDEVLDELNARVTSKGTKDANNNLVGDLTLIHKLLSEKIHSPEGSKLKEALLEMLLPD